MKIKSGYGLFSILIVIISWQLLAYYVGDASKFPSLNALLEELFNMIISPDFYSSLGTTIVRGLIGFGIAFVLSASLATLSAHNQNFKVFFQPIVVITRSIPVISLVLIALLIISPPKLPIFIALITMFPILYQDILSGLEHTDIKLVDKAKIYRKSNFQRFKFIYYPYARKFIFAGMATSMGFGWRAVIIGEVLAVPLRGIGSNMKQAQASFNVSELLAWTVVAVLVSFVFDFLLKLIEKNKLVCNSKLKYSSKDIHSIEKGFKQLNLTNISVRIDNKTIIDDLTFTVTNEKINFLKGVSGSGKTTLIDVIAGTKKFEKGKMDFNISNPVVSYAFQDNRLIPWLTLEQNIAFVLPSYPNISEDEKSKIENLINLLELSEHKHKLPDELSGGEAQRVTLAVALILPCDILLLDEPITGVESELKTRMIEIIENLTDKYRPIILWATHDDLKEHLTSGYNEIVLNKHSK
ncbi:hypothetical protein MASR2M117_09350 [Paludibacter sp.]